VLGLAYSSYIADKNKSLKACSHWYDDSSIKLSCYRRHGQLNRSCIPNFSYHHLH